MQSFKSRLFNFLMRNRHFFKGKLKKDVFDFNTSIEGFRELCEKGASKYAKIPDGIEIKEENINGIHAEWIVPQNAHKENVILYVHGGGYVSGSCNDHRGFVSKFANHCGISTLQFEYRLAPEHPFPAGLNDSVAVYNWLLHQGFDSVNIVIAGESAGGGLTLALLLALKEQKLSMPAAAAAISPWTDLTCSSDSYKNKNKVSVAPLNSWLVFSKHYCGNNPPTLPLISPLFGELEGLPPIFINAAEDDELFEDGEKFYHKAKDAGVDVTFRAGKGMIHCYPMLAPFFREATDAMQEICEFINMHIGKS
ncbi:alpha/beta hydrolase [candidate division KSB1 bacterium]|nr:alpha/beta hydrolase [candidate division KSB1 bacterium]